MNRGGGKPFDCTVEELEQAIKDSSTWSEAGRKLGGFIGCRIKRKAIKFNIDSSHMTHTTKGIPSPFKVTAKDILVKNRSKLGYKEKRDHLLRALNEVGVEYKCESCGMTDKWNGKPILLEIDHINGDCFDNTKDNLRFLCPNCHSQTDTHSHSGNSGRKKKYREKPHGHGYAGK